MQRKGMAIGKGSGYYNIAPKDPMIHSLSAKGVKTKMPLVRTFKKTLKAEGDKLTPEEQKRYDDVVSEDYKDYLSEEDFLEIEKEVGGDIEEVSEYHVDYLGTKEGWLEVKVNGETWVVAPSDDEAEKVATEMVEEMLEDEPETFEPNWLQNHIDTDHLKDQLESDVSNSNYDYFHDIESENDSEYGDRQKQELVESGDLDWDEYSEMKEDIEKLEEDENPDEETISKIRKKMESMVEDAIEDAVEKKTEEQLEDPIEYLEDLFGKGEAMKEAIRIGGINYEEASEDAVSTDGWQHFLNHYDGNSTELKSGKVMFRMD
jgi:hypothetical protein